MTSSASHPASALAAGSCPIVRLEGVSRRYGAGAVTVQALHDVSLAVAPGSFMALAGPSGSGKSTLLNVMSGLDRPTSGRVFVEGAELTALGRAEVVDLRRRRIGFVFQAYNLMPVLTAQENAEYVLLLQGVPLRERRRVASEMLERVGLGGLGHRFPRELSGGQQQRVAIARAIAPRPALVLADEPTANLDRKTGASLLDLMAELNGERGVTFVFSSHDPAVLQRADRIVSLSDGAVVADGAPNRTALR